MGHAILIYWILKTNDLFSREVPEQWSDLIVLCQKAFQIFEWTIYNTEPSSQRHVPNSWCYGPLQYICIEIRLWWKLDYSSYQGPRINEVPETLTIKKKFVKINNYFHVSTQRPKFRTPIFARSYL